MDTTPNTRRKKRKQHQMVRQQIAAHSVQRNTSGRDVATAMLFPITLPLRCGWWLVCHPIQLTVIATAAFWAMPIGWLP